MTEIPSAGGHPALTDAATGLPNRLHFDTVLAVTFAASKRGIPLSLVLLEVAEYQAWANRTPAGQASQTLWSVGRALDGSVRQSDLVARLDSGRFAFLLLDCDRAGGRIVAERIDKVATPFRKEMDSAISIGVAEYHGSMAEPEDLVAAADRALHEVQAQGGGKIGVQ